MSLKLHSSGTSATIRMADGDFEKVADDQASRLEKRKFCICLSALLRGKPLDVYYAR